MSNYPNGFNSGVAILNMPHQSLVDPKTKVYWVDSNAAVQSDGSYKKPFATIADAIAKALTGDLILIAAGHTENLTVVATIPIAAVVGVTSDGTETKTFTITGTDVNGTVVTDTVVNPDTETLYTTQIFKTVTSVAISGAGVANITVGVVADPNGICETSTPSGALNMVMNGAYVTAVGFNVSTAGLTIIGMGEGLRIPTFTTTAQLSAVMITVANTVLENLKFVANITDCVQAIDLTLAADGTIIRNCVFRDSSASLDFLKHIDIATTVTEIVIEGCDFTTAAGGMTSSIFFTGTSSNVIIRNSVWHVDCSASVIDHLTADPLNILIHGNRLVNIDTTSTLGLGLKSDTSGTGQVFDNYLWGATGASDVFAVTNDYFVAENYSSNDINASGVLQPAADSIA